MQLGLLLGSSVATIAGVLAIEVGMRQAFLFFGSLHLV